MKAPILATLIAACSVLPTASQEYSISKVPPHPRLLANAEDFVRMKANLENTDLGRKARSRMLHLAEFYASLPDLAYVRDESGRRILHISRSAIARILGGAMAWRISGERKYADSAIHSALTVSAFKDWNPSHFLDTAEMTLAVAFAYDWLYDCLTPEQRKTLEQAIIMKGLTTDGTRLHAGGWLKSRNNWNQVCNGGLTCGAIAIADINPRLAEQIINRTVKSIPIAMASFAPDGGFPEGPAAYWPYAMEFNMIAIAAIEKFTGKESNLVKLPGFAAEAEYMDSCTGPSGHLFNYSDAGCGSPPRHEDFVQWWLATRLNRPDTLVMHERRLFERALARKSPYGYCRFFPLTLLYLDANSPEREPRTPRCRIMHGENPIAVMRTSWTDPLAWFAGIKGGMPSLSHGHMDIGSFVLDADGVRWVSDIGCEAYARIEKEKIGLWNMRQSSDRWKLFRYSTEGHSTLQFNDEPQLVDKKAGFTTDAPVCADGATTVTLDLSKTYGRNRNCLRTFSLLDKGGFIVEDDISNAKPGETVTWRVNTFAKVSTNGNKATLTAKDGSGTVRTMHVTAFPKDVSFHAVDCSKRRQPYESDTPGLVQLTFKYTIPQSRNLRFKVMFEK